MPSAGVSEISQFDWKHKLDLISCTECGRCQAVCPAYASGLPLSPKTLIMDLRDFMAEEGKTGPLIGGAIAEETLWACTTCRACEEAVVQAPAPERPIDGGMATEALLAHVLVNKYADHLPLYRQAQIFAR